MNLTLNNITFAHFSTLKSGEIFKNYSNLRGVCGIVVPISGSANYTFSDGSECSLNYGKIAVFSSKSSYVLNNNSDEDFVHYTVNFSLCNDEDLIFDIGFSEPENISYCVNSVKEIIDYAAVGDFLRAKSLLYGLLANLFDDISEQNISKNFEKGVKPAADYIECEYCQHITIDILARKCMMSKTNFRRCFSAAYGVSPIEYLICVRLNKAKQLLVHTALPVTEISNLCGFNEVSYFSRIFKNRFSISPLEYRSKIQKTGIF